MEFSTMLNLATHNFLLLITVISSFLACILIIKTKAKHAKFTNDSSEGPQKFHKGEVPRIGGLAIFIVFACYAIFVLKNNFYNLLILSSAPIFLGGFCEDVLKSVSSKFRLLLSVFSGFLFVYFSGLQLNSTGVFIIDSFLVNNQIWAVITIISIGALVNGINIIDGFNGLASGSTIIMALTLLFLARINGIDDLSLFLSIFVAVHLGFFILNFPKGLLFLGDGGSYFSGFILATSAIILVNKSAEIIPIVLLVIFAYPCFELLFSIVRKTIRAGHSPDKPDSVHLHMLVHRSFRHLARKLKMNKNATTSLIMLVFPISGFCFVQLVEISEINALIYLASFAVVYLALYRKVSLNGNILKLFKPANFN